MEVLAQAAGILSFKTMGEMPDENSVFYFVGIDNARFKKPVSAGDQLLSPCGDCPSDAWYLEIQRSGQSRW